MKTFLLIDANSIIHRCFHALPELTTPKGEPIQAVYGLASVFLKISREDPPDYAVAAFDRKEKTFRAEMFKEYKAHRPPTPVELISQIKKSYEFFDVFNIRTLNLAGFEADDIIGTLAEKFKREDDLRIIILSGDLDNLQLIDENVFVRTFLKGVSETILYDEKGVEERYGLKPGQLSDYKGLVGDASDNIPGVPGVGPKTALPIIKTYDTLENFYGKAKKMKFDSVSSSREEKLYKKLLEFEKQALQSRDLAVIKRDIPIELGPLKEFSWIKPDSVKLREYFQELGFKTLVKRVDDKPQMATDTGRIATDIPGNAVFFKDADAALKTEKSVTESKDALKIGFGIKSILKAFKSQERNFSPPYFDLGIAYWLIDPDLKKYDVENLSKRGDWPLLYSSARKKLKEYELENIFENMEMPFIDVLSEMELRGIGIDVEYLKKLSRETEVKIRELEDGVYKVAGLKFNLNSPQQLGEVLFKKMGIGVKGIKKTKKGNLSTAFENLETLKEAHPIISLILKYREFFKLRSTYIEPLIRLVGDDGRIRTTYVQTGTATGRLSSQEPNLQNIPIGSEWAVKLRNAFVADNGFSFVSFDYSQIELRILASLSGDERMLEVFKRGEDIHTATAAGIFNVPPEKVTAEMRRAAKTLNFGIIYGMGAVSFSETSGLSREDARRFIDEYFEKFPAVKNWQEKVKEEARTFGFVKNPNGRRRWLFGAVSANRGVAAEGERIAINMPVQSLDADIMKLAMIKLYKELGLRKWRDESVRMLLTIHDELLFEISDDIIKEAIPLIRDIMESIYKFSVPLKVDVAVGKRWGEMGK
ncbi:MAG: polymerase protein [Parcubacteria group bacterium GW2011_GWB1_45_9]|nr:MAG: polymerase protein [Parcubacteria group bacterium GW2011_GWB1_45_9]